MSWLVLLLSLVATAPASDRPTVIVVVGAEGAPEYGRNFAQWADRWVKAAEQGSARVLQIGRDAESSTAPTTDKDRLDALLESNAQDQTQPLWLVFIGHGTSDGREAKFNLRGPDVSDTELAEWLKPIHRPIAIIDCSAASAPFVNRLSGEHRVVITATRSGSEIQFAHFGEYLSAAIADPTADLDKDGQTSLLEAFLAASHRVEEFYKQAGRLATEHALLDDNSDTLGVAADWFEGLHVRDSAKKGAAKIDGAYAHQWHLVLSSEERAISTELRAQRDELELQIEALRQKKATFAEEAYYAQLEELLLKLAKIYQEIDTAR